MDNDNNKKIRKLIKQKIQLDNIELFILETIHKYKEEINNLNKLSKDTTICFYNIMKHTK